MNENRSKHAGRYAAVYNRGYQTSAESTYGNPTKGEGEDIFSEKHIFGIIRFDSHVDDYTKRMSPKAAAAFEDGWFDAKEDGADPSSLKSSR